MHSTVKGDSSVKLQGIIWGLTGSMAWAGYNVGSKLGRVQGFDALDLTMLRYGFAAILFLPLIARNGPPTSAGRLAVLLLLTGPLFGVLINTGFGLAPIAHAVVLGPSFTLMTSNALAWVLDGRRPSLTRICGVVILLAGLCAIAFAKSADTTVSSYSFLGDACFVCTGTMWGIYVYLLGRWKIDPVRGTGWLVSLSAAIILPFYILFRETAEMPPQIWVQQFLFQGVLGGFLGGLAVAKAVSRLGPALAGIFPAVVPAAAVLLAIPLLDQIPTIAETIGVAICTVGLVIALEPSQILRGSRNSRTINSSTSANK